MIFSICLGKKNAVAIEFLGFIKKKYFSKKKKFGFKKKEMFCLTEKLFLFFTIFKLDSITQIIYFIIQIRLYSLLILLLFSYISLQETGHRKNINPSLMIQVAKNKNK